MAITDLQARGIILLALAKRGLAVGAAAVQILQAIARHESGYGVLLGEQHHNWGAVHCVHGPPCHEGCFQRGDKDASGKSYPACLRSYDSDVEGAADMVRELYRRPHVAAALTAGDVLATAHAMGTAAAGIGAYHQSPAHQYGAAVHKHVRALAAALGEPVAAVWSRPAPQLPPPQPSPPHHQPLHPSVPVPSTPKSSSMWAWALGATALFIATRVRAGRLEASTLKGQQP